jgi:hypothetical protein
MSDRMSPIVTKRTCRADLTMSVDGTFRTCRNNLTLSAHRGKADIPPQGSNFRFWT